MSKFTSVITSTFNKSKYLDLTLAGFTLQYDKNFEIVIVDDGSKDNTKDIVESYKDQLDIQYIYQENKGIPRARNKALDAARGDFIIIIDDDRIPSPNFVSEHKKVLVQKTPLVSIGQQHRILTNYSNDVPLPFEEWMRIFGKYPEFTETIDEIQLVTATDWIRDYRQVIDKYRLGLYDPGLMSRLINEYGENLDNYHFGWTKAYGGNMAFDRTYLTTELRYDENFTGYAVEDVDISYQLYTQNYKFIFTKLANNFHQEHPRNIRERQFQYRNIKYLLEKHNNLEMYLHEMEIRGQAHFHCVNFLLDILVRDPSIIDKMKEYVKRKKIE